MYEAFPKVIWMFEVVVPGDMDVWGRLRQSPGRGRTALMTGQDPRLCHLGFHYRITSTKKDCHPAFITKLPPAPFTWPGGGGVSCYIEGGEPISGVILTFSNFGN